MISGQTKPQGIIILGHIKGKVINKNFTQWDFKFGRQLNSLVDLYFAVRGRIEKEALKMEDENSWKHLDLHLLDRLARAGLAGLY